MNNKTNSVYIVRIVNYDFCLCTTEAEAQEISDLSPLLEYEKVSDSFLAGVTCALMIQAEIIKRKYWKKGLDIRN